MKRISCLKGSWLPRGIIFLCCVFSLKERHLVSWSIRAWKVVRGLGLELKDTSTSWTGAAEGLNLDQDAEGGFSNSAAAHHILWQHNGGIIYWYSLTSSLEFLFYFEISFSVCPVLLHISCLCSCPSTVIVCLALIGVTCVVYSLSIWVHVLPRPLPICCVTHKPLPSLSPCSSKCFMDFV